MNRLCMAILASLGMLVVGASAFGQDDVAAAPGTEVVTVFDRTSINYDAERSEESARDDDLLLNFGQIVQRSVALPRPPSHQRDARRIVAKVTVEPVLTEVDGTRRPGDLWTRIGSINVLAPSAAGGDPHPVEIIRFITGFGGTCVFEQDVTALAPLLHGTQTFQAAISTFMNPAYRVTMTLAYDATGIGARRPVYAEPLFFNALVTSDKNVLATKVTVPETVTQFRLRITSSGHASDGQPGDEFITRPHVVLLDGTEVARFRPWSEAGGPNRAVNPTSGRMTIDGREIWSSDFDRSGWMPGMAVEPRIIPLPELTPGDHVITLRIEGIRPFSEATNGRGYWRVQGILVADEPWPEE